MRKLHKQEYTYKHVERRLEQVTLEQVKKITEAYLPHWYSIRPIVRDNGRIILAFRSEARFEEFLLTGQHDGFMKDTWLQWEDEKRFKFSDEYENYNVIVAEFWTREKFQYEEGLEAERFANSYFGIKEDDGNYSKYDVYSERELL